MSQTHVPSPRRPLAVASRLSLSLALLAALGASACSPNVSSSAACTANSQCPAGSICMSGRCRDVCASDFECTVGHVCDDGVCAAGERAANAAPVIDQVDGDGDTLCPDAAGSHCIAEAMVLRGTNLTGARYTLLPENGPELALAVLESEAQRTRLSLEGVPPGQYLLSAANQAGAATASVTLLQGPQGPPGPPGAGGAGQPNDLVASLNTATTLVSANILPIGSGATQVARGNHGHDATSITSGVLDINRLPTGAGATQVALGNHQHSEYAPLAHSHLGYQTTLISSPTYYASSLNGAGSGGSMNTAMTPVATSFCFLSSVSFQDVDGGAERVWCTVSDISGTWNLTAHSQSGDDADAYCEARCLEF